MTFARTSGTEKQCIFSPGNETGGCQIENEAAVHFRIEGEIEVVERFLGIAELGLFAAPFEQTVGASCEFVTYEAGDQVNGRHRFGLRLVDAGFQDGRYAAEAELS
jgi:hypothetical protein